MIKNIGVFKDFSDNSLKSVFDVGNKQIIEMTLLANKEEIDVVCVPTHHFCNLGCKMCHLTNKGLNKAMMPIKANDFITCLIQTLTKNGVRRTNKRRLLISFMGVGEPLLNLKLIEDVYNMETVLREKLGYEHIGYALATMMPNKNILDLTTLVDRLNIPLKVHFSMHTPIDNKRFDLIPSTKVNIEEALAYLIKYRKCVQANDEIMREYIELHRTNDPVEIHYTLIKGVNDSQEELDKVCQILSKYNIPIKFIRFNPINDLKISGKEEIWVSEISKQLPGLRIKTYSPPGREIGSSCGEFTKHYYHEEIETEEERKGFEQWFLKHRVLEQQRNDNLSWDEYFMAIAKLSAMRSKDPNTQVGACIVSADNRILSIGYNGAPNGYLDECFPWQRDGNPLDTKYMYVVHAERNAILNYRGSRKELENSKIYVDLFPCNECAKEIIQAGIKEVIYLSDKYAGTKETIASKRLFDICGVTYRRLAPEKQKVLKLSLEV